MKLLSRRDNGKLTPSPCRPLTGQGSPRPNDQNSDACNSPFTFQIFAVVPRIIASPTSVSIASPRCLQSIKDEDCDGRRSCHHEYFSSCNASTNVRFDLEYDARHSSLLESSIEGNIYHNSLTSRLFLGAKKTTQNRADTQTTPNVASCRIEH